MDTFEKDLKVRLVPLNKEKKLLFALLICEKLYPNYLYFQRSCDWGEPNVLLEAIKVKYQWLFNSESFSNEEIQEHMDAVDAVTPDTEDFLHVSVSLALDACTAVYSSLNFIIDQDVEHIIFVSTYARDTIYMTIEDESTTAILNNPFMAKEISRQYSVIEELKKLKNRRIDDELIQRLKESDAIIDLEAL